MNQTLSSNQLMHAIKGGLIVSVQPRPPLDSAEWVATVSQVAIEAGAAGLRLDGAENIRAARNLVPAPIIGIKKLRTRESPVYITPTVQSAVEVIEAGCDIVALDGAPADRPANAKLGELIAEIHVHGKLAMADISSLDDARHALDSGADILSTTMSGYTSYSPQQPGPDINLLTELISLGAVPVIAEGRYNTPALFRTALDAGAHSVVVGKAITEPRFIVESFLDARG